MKFRSAGYLFAPSPIYHWVGQVFFEGGTTESWWDQLPWHYIYAFSFGVFVALLIFDISERSSWLRRLWHRLFGVFDVVGLNSTNKIDPNRVTLTARIRFRKRLSDGELKIYATNLTTGKGERSLVHYESIGKKTKNEIVAYPVASLAIPEPGWEPRECVFGVDVPPMKALDGDLKGLHTLHLGGPILVEVEIRGESHGAVVYAHNLSNTAGRGFSVVSEDVAEKVMTAI